MPLMPGAQFAFFAIVAVLALALRRLPGHLPTLALASLALLATLRYVWWRTTQTLDFRSPVEAVAGYLLYGAEAYAWMILLLGFIQTAWPLDRPIVPLPADPDTWPSVDIYIPTYNEPLSVVKPTVFAAQSIDWPTAKLRVYLLDDGRRQFEFAREAGIGYLTRDDNRMQRRATSTRAAENARRIHRDLRLRSRADALVPADHDGRVPARPEMRAGADAAPLLLARSVRAQPRHVPRGAERRQSVLRARAVGQRPVERDVLLRLVRGAQARALEEVGGVAVETVTEDAHRARCIGAATRPRTCRPCRPRARPRAWRAT
jgi:cellulose synthase (UDP-forming)